MCRFDNSKDLKDYPEANQFVLFGDICEFGIYGVSTSSFTKNFKCNNSENCYCGMDATKKEGD